jgi:hypothetical protein
MKRGKATREVLAQTFDYAAFADGLKWEDVDRLCQKRHSTDLATIFAKTFGKTINKGRSQSTASRSSPKFLAQKSSTLRCTT